MPYSAPLYVRDGSIASIPLCTSHVRFAPNSDHFAPNSDHKADVPAGRFGAKSRREIADCSKKSTIEAIPD
jgi:hypothetical protein